MIQYSTELLAELDFYTEGPAVDPSGNLYYTTLTGGEIQMITPSGEKRSWAHGDCPNGQAIDPDGYHWVCESRLARITKYTPNGELADVILDGQCAGEPFSTPNDLIFDKKGNLYFTESIRHHGKVFFRSTDGFEKVLASGVDYANGLALNPAGDQLYVAESYQNRILVIDLQTSDVTIFAHLPENPSGEPIENLPDGLAVDQEGRVWVAHYGMGAVQILSPEGGFIQSINTGLPLTSNLTLLSELPDRKEILITGGFLEPGPGGVVKACLKF